MHPRVSTRTRLAASALSLLGLAAASAEAVTQPFPKGSTLTLTTSRTVGDLKFSFNAYHGVIVQDATGGILWRSGGLASPCSDNKCWAVYQHDGNFVIYRDVNGVAKDLWASDTRLSSQMVLSSEAPYITIQQPDKAPWTTGVAPVSLAYLPGGLNLAAGSRIAVGDTSLQLTTGGDVQIRRVSTNALLWQSGTAAACAQPTSCSLAFGGDGTLKLTGPGGAGNVVWTAGFGTGPAGTLVLSKYAPYLTIQERGQNDTSPVKWATGNDASSVTYASHAFGLGVGQRVSVGGVTLALTERGKVELTDATGRLVWSPQPACVVLAECGLNFGADGNLVLYTRAGPGAGISLSNTLNNDATLHLSATAPYLRIENTKFERIWATDPVSPPPQRVVAQPRVGNDFKAQPVQSFLSTLGINVQLKQYWQDDQLLIRELDRIGGLRTIRILLPADDTQLATYKRLAAQGVRFNLFSYNTDAAFIAQQVRALNAATNGAVESVEGLNEINNFGAGFKGFTCRGGIPNNCGGMAAEAQTSLFNTFTQAPDLQSVAVYGLGAGNTALQAPRHGLLGIAGRAHYATVHPYTKPEDAQPLETFARAMDNEYVNLTPLQGVVTEAGYTTAAVSQESQAIMNVNAWLDGYRLGYRRTFLYGLKDVDNQQYGFLDGSGTAKRVAEVTKKLLALLNDGGQPLQNTGTLVWDNRLFSGNWILLQKSNGKFYLILWNEPKVATGQTNESISATPTLISVLGAKDIKVYDPFLADPWVPKPVVPTGGLSTGVTVDIGSHPIVVEVTPY